MNTYTPAESALCAAARAVLAEQRIAGGVLPIPGTSQIVAFGDREQIAMLAASSAQQAAGSIDTPWQGMLLSLADHIENLHDFPPVRWGIMGTVLVKAAREMLEAAATPAQPIGIVATYNRGGSGEHNGIEPIGKAHHSLAEALPAGTLLYAAPVAQPIAVSAPIDELAVTDEMVEAWIKFASKATYLQHPKVAPYEGTANGDSAEAWHRRYVKAAISEVIAARAAAPVDDMTDKLLTIIAYAYQVAGAHDAPDHILDVLANPEEATDEQIEAMLPYVPAPVSGQGASIGDDAEFRKLTRLWRDLAPTSAGAKAWASLVHFIDSRPRSEDSRALKVLEAMNHMGGDERGGYCICPVNDGSAPDHKHATICVDARRALASTTPQKADDE